jgi:hypothetical protein
LTTRAKHGLIIITALAVLLAAAIVATQSRSAQAAEGGNGLQPFIGLWAGISAGDGSLFHTSVSDNDGNGVAEILMHDTGWSICGNTPALVTGTGTVDDGVLTTVISIACEGGDVFDGLVVPYTKISPGIIEIAGPVPPGPVYKISTR